MSFLLKFLFPCVYPFLIFYSVFVYHVLQLLSSKSIQLFQFTLSDQSFKGTGQDRLPTTSSTWNPNISFIQMARHRRSSLYGRGIVNFADNYSLRSHIPLRSCLVGLRLWSDNVNWNNCINIIRRSIQVLSSSPLPPSGNPSAVDRHPWPRVRGIWTGSVKFFRRNTCVYLLI